MYMITILNTHCVNKTLNVASDLSHFVIEPTLLFTVVNNVTS